MYELFSKMYYRIKHFTTPFYFHFNFYLFNIQLAEESGEHFNYYNYKYLNEATSRSRFMWHLELHLKFSLKKFKSTKPKFDTNICFFHEL